MRRNESLLKFLCLKMFQPVSANASDSSWCFCRVQRHLKSILKCRSEVNSTCLQKNLYLFYFFIFYFFLQRLQFFFFFSGVTVVVFTWLPLKEGKKRSVYFLYTLLNDFLMVKIYVREELNMMSSHFFWFKNK